LDNEVQRALDKEVSLLKEMRHPNIILFMGLVLEPAAVVTGGLVGGGLGVVLWVRCIGLGVMPGVCQCSLCLFP
jgi:hypothetical protein